MMIVAAWQQGWEFGHEIEKPKLCTSGWQSTTRMPMTTCMLAWHSTTRTSMTSSMIAWLRTMRTPATTSTERRAHFLRLCCRVFHLHTHAPWLKFAPFIPSPYSCSLVRSLHLDPPFLLLALASAPFPLPQLHEVYGKPAQLLQWGCGRLWRPPLLHTLGR